jgi:pimeloyl-ACP methyl ester carboxylesterase
MKYLELNDGGGQTVVLVHGGNVAGWMWGEQVAALGEFHLLVPDLPGFGASNDERWVSQADSADRLAELIAQKGRGGAAHIVGLSLGAGVAVYLAARHPARVTSLLISSTSIIPLSRGAQLVGRTMLAAWNRRWFWSALARGYGLPADSVELFVETGLGIRRETALAVFDEVTRGVASEQLAAIRAPTLAVAGSRDTPAVKSLEPLRHITGALVATAPGMHHQWNIENVDLFNAMVVQWITRSTIADGLANTSADEGRQSQRE